MIHELLEDLGTLVEGPYSKKAKARRRRRWKPGVSKKRKRKKAMGRTMKRMRLARQMRSM